MQRRDRRTPRGLGGRLFEQCTFNNPATSASFQRTKAIERLLISKL